MKGKTYKLTLPAEASRALYKGDRWTGEVSLEPLDQETPKPRRKAGGLLAATSQRQPTAEEQLVIDAWNNSPDRGDAHNASPNRGGAKKNALLLDPSADEMDVITKAIRKLGFDGLTTAMCDYLAFCAEGSHVWAGVDHGYRSLDGLCKALVQSDYCELYWVDRRPLIRDDHPDATKALADAFARKFLGRQNFGLKNPSTAYERFKAADDIISAMQPKMPFDHDGLVKALFDCLEDYWVEGQGQAVQPGHLCSKHTWGILLPQWIKRTLG